MIMSPGSTFLPGADVVNGLVPVLTHSRDTLEILLRAHVTCWPCQPQEVEHTAVTRAVRTPRWQGDFPLTLLLWVTAKGHQRVSAIGAGMSSTREFRKLAMKGSQTKGPMPFLTWVDIRSHLWKVFGFIKVCFILDNWDKEILTVQ